MTQPISLLDSNGIAPERAKRLVGEALTGADDGELFVEYRQSETLGFDNGRLKVANFDTAQGMGLRAVAGEAAGYAHASEISESAVSRLGNAVGVVKAGHSGTFAAPPQRSNVQLYGEENPLGAPK